MRGAVLHRSTVASRARVFGAVVLHAGISMGTLAGCADLDGSEAQGIPVHVACTNSLQPNVFHLMGWELSVEPTGPVRAGETFDAVLGGTLVIREEFLEAAQNNADLREINLIEVAATVHVRAGATGSDVQLTATDALGYTCFEDRSTSCDPSNDQPGGVPGRLPNSDCQPMSEQNPCGRFVPVPREDCAREGICEQRGKQAACATHGYCVYEDVRVKLGPAVEEYTVEPGAVGVLFGWDDERTGAIRTTDASDREVWLLPPANFEGDFGPNSIRADLAPASPGGEAVALECTMGVDTIDPSSDAPTIGSASPTPPEMLIKILVQ